MDEPRERPEDLEGPVVEGPGVAPQPGEPPRVDLDPALVDVAHPTEGQRIRRGGLLGAGLGVALLLLARRRRER